MSKNLKGVRERFEERFGKLYVRNNPSGGYFEIAPDLIPAFIESEISAQEVRVREEVMAELDTLWVNNHETSGDFERAFLEWSGDSKTLQ